MKKNVLLFFSIIFGTLLSIASIQAKIPKNLALTGSIHSDSGYESAEPSSNIIDGITYTSDLSKKWCKASYGTGMTHWVIIDLGNESEIASFRIYDCKVNEPNQSNFGKYNIYVGNDIEKVKDWEKVVSQTGRAGDNIKEDALPNSIMARYVKLEIPDFGTLRVWEFEIYDSAQNIIIPIHANEKATDGEKISVTIPYTLKIPKAEDFSYEVTSSNKYFTLSNIIQSDENSHITFKVATPMRFESTDIAVTITNNGETQLTNFKAKAHVTDPFSMYVNVAKNKNSSVHHYSPWEDSDAPEIVDGDENTFFSLNKEMIEPIVDLTDTYIINSVQYIYKCASLDGGAGKFSEVLVYVSPTINAGTDDAVYIRQDDRLSGSEVGILMKEVAVLDAPTLAGSLKFKFNSSGWGLKEMELYEVKAFCEKPILSQLKNMDIEIGVLKPLQATFDLKGFSSSNKENIRFDVTSNNADITIENVSADFETKTLDFSILSDRSKAEAKITVKISHPDFEVTSDFIVVTETDTSIESNDEKAYSIYPTIVNRGEDIRISADATSVRLVSLQGTTMLEKQLDNNSTKLSTATLASGVYLIQLTGNKTSFKPVKVVIR